ncbi:MAG TPA: HAMP domain-containing sensor histidine kinase [Solirubrobacterales bacterium]|nr:HAMP domain-containing sensor histidine kinase [Solirubrobacterales bacterium]
MSLRARLLAAFAYTLIVVIVALEVPLSANVSDRVNAEVEADSAAKAQVVAASAADQLHDRASLERISRQAAVSLNGLVFVIDGSGRQIASSTGSITRPPQPTDDPVALQALGGEVAQGRHHEGQDILSTAVPIVRNGRTVGALELEQSLNAVRDQVRQDVLALIGIGVLALILGLGVAWILAGSIARPLRSLGEAARRRAAGDASARAPERGSREQVQVAREFNEMADRLDAVLESQRAFVADASHQLRTPLTGLRLRLEAAGVKTSDPAVARELAAAEHETERLNQLVEDLLELASSEQPAEDDRTDLTQAARAAAERWRGPASESRHEIALETDGDLVVRAGSRELAAILDNLVENAIKYSPSGSPVTIECAGENGSATVGVISDSGPLDDEVASHAFERFYRGRGAGPGTGLGLPIVQALAKRRGGRARLEAVDQRRVRAEVMLPIADFANS